MRNRRQSAGRRVAIVNHIPDHPIRDGHVFGGTIHPEGNCAAAPQRRSYTAAYACQTEVVAEYRNAGLAETANDGLHFLDLLRTLRTIEQNIVPVRGVEVLDCG